MRGLGQLGSDELAPRRIAADDLAPIRFGAETFWRKHFAADTVWHQYGLALIRYGAEMFWLREVLASINNFTVSPKYVSYSVYFLFYHTLASSIIEFPKFGLRKHEKTGIFFVASPAHISAFNPQKLFFRRFN